MSKSVHSEIDSRDVFETLAKNGPMSHEQLVNETGTDWDEIQKVIRKLRTKGIVSITLDRRYDVEINEAELPA
jgi:transcription initiation factor IIE alpha subunit